MDANYDHKQAAKEDMASHMAHGGLLAALAFGVMKIMGQDTATAARNSLAIGGGSIAYMSLFDHSPPTELRGAAVRMLRKPGCGCGCGGGGKKPCGCKGKAGKKPCGCKGGEHDHDHNHDHNHSEG